MFLCIYVRASSICIQVRARARVDILNVFTAFVHVHCVFTALFSNEMFIDCLFILIVAITEPFFVCHGKTTQLNLKEISALFLHLIFHRLTVVRVSLCSLI